ncbi:hypothetical protein MKW94_021383, partial [Papaver nudicaule]|nr:hypothetical protein [Papaver nudicaule]
LQGVIVLLPGKVIAHLDEGFGTTSVWVLEFLKNFLLQLVSLWTRPILLFSEGVHANS